MQEAPKKVEASSAEVAEIGQFRFSVRKRDRLHTGCQILRSVNF